MSNLGSKQESGTENQIFWCENKVGIEEKGLTPALNLSKTQMSFDSYLFDLTIVRAKLVPVEDNIYLAQFPERVEDPAMVLIPWIP